MMLFILLGLSSLLTAKDELPRIPADEIAPKDTLFHDPLMKGIQLVYQDRFEESLSIFDRLQKAFPEHPAPNFYKAAALQSWMSSYRINAFKKELEFNVQQAIDKGNALLKKRSMDPWINFYLGASYGYRAFFRMRGFNWIGAYRDGLKGIGNFNDALKKQPIRLNAHSLQQLQEEGLPANILAKLEGRLVKTVYGLETFQDSLELLIGDNALEKYGPQIYRASQRTPAIWDVYLGLGTYHYWRTARSKFIRIIAFWMKDKRDLGVKQMRFSIQHGRYSPDEASLALVTALYDYGKYREGLDELEKYIRKTGSNIISTLYLKGLLLAKFDRWDETRTIFGEILGRLKAHPYQSVGFQVECKYWIALSLQGSGKFAEALALTNEALAQSKTRNSDAELEGQFNSFDDTLKLLKKLKKNLEEQAP